MQKCCSAPNTHVFFQSVRRTEQLIVEGDQLFFRQLKLLIINRLELLFEIDNGARIGDVMVRLREMSKCYDLCVVFTMARCEHTAKLGSYCDVVLQIDNKNSS